MTRPDTRGLLYDPKYEHDGCGVGFVADISGRRSFSILEKAVAAVSNVSHRGAVSADAKTGDGAGVMAQLPVKLFQREVQRLGQRLEKGSDLAVGMIFLPGRDDEARRRLVELIDVAVERAGLHRFGWRQVPVDRSALGQTALDIEPSVQQVLMARPAGMSDGEFPQALYTARREIESRAKEHGAEDCYIPSFSHKTIVYKGMMVASPLDHYYPDLRDPDFETALAVYHQRYSTNTFPNWFLAQPFRMLAHNGEINTLQGNCNWMRAREPELQCAAWGDRIRQLVPIIEESGSDSAKLDNVAELLTHSGRGILHTMMMLVPEAWENMPHMKPAWKAFYQYHACLTEPWDGPAALAFTDGDIVGACLDRNGLRPARYKYTDDGIIVMGSEVGVVEMDDAHVVEKGRLGPGQMIAVDTTRGQLLNNDEIKDMVSRRKPYGKWVRRRLFQLGSTASKTPTDGYRTHANLFQAQRIFGYTLEDLSFVIKAMILEAKEPIFSMGDDTPISVLALKPRLLYSFFKQRFAQVTNPPIDPLREDLVMSLHSYLGQRRSILEETDEHAHLVHVDSPIISNEDLQALRSLDDPVFKTATLQATFDIDNGPEELERAVDAVCQAADQAVDDGASILILSDRKFSDRRAPIPMLLAVGAVHQHLIRGGRRMKASIVAESAEPREVHHFACLLGYGAAAVNPYLGFESLAELIEEGEIEDMSLMEAQKNYRRALDNGILKIMSKMGISTVTSYQGAQVFEALGIGRELIDRCFTGTTSWIEGIGMKELAEGIIQRHRQALVVTGAKKLEDPGYYRYRRDGEEHRNSPRIVKALHAAVTSGSYEDYKVFSSLVNDREPMAIRDLLRFKPQTPIHLDKVEPIESIVRRFNTAAMSLGALSPEAHVTLAAAMNKLGAMSDTGEGGDEPGRYWAPSDGGVDYHSKIKQVASGRFGVTTEYLASAEELEIKMAQGSKPGEGGQLPGHKVVEHIARLRHAVPGIQLISPPPHHDIYSIEDLAQLIHDLKEVNPRARIGVKLVSEAGVGTIAAGVAKGYADNILISGDSGGTGASPLSSIKNAGTPWELGLAETQQVLVLNDLRGRVLLRTDGGLRTGRDVVVAAMLGAEAFGFGTGALIAIGCKMARQCHLNTCPVGVATQKEELRQKFFGTPEMAIHYFTHVAMEVREILASLGVRSIEDVVGRAGMMEAIESDNPRVKMLDLSRLLADPDPSGVKPRHRVQDRNDRTGDVPLDDQILVDAADALSGEGPVTLEYEIKNVNRDVGTKVSGELAYRWRTSALETHVAELRFRGSAGQSFGAFCVGGLRLVMEGEANDYVGKGMAGGEIILRPPKNAAFAPHENIIIGNTVLYGATGGFLFASGRAGERFAVRNSGAVAVIEGAGDHCCEYMTAGLVVVLGETGRNFGAGMSNGRAYVLDEDDEFPQRYNPDMVTIGRVTDPEDVDTLRSLIQRHLDLTESPRAREVLNGWERYLPLFWKVAPMGAIGADGARAIAPTTRV
ncbi:MAG: glutamate synthase large subunit [Dehalococcoidia bacterium]